MPNLRDRDEHEATLARVIGRVTADQRRRLLAAMGSPPRVENIPAALWAELEREQRAMSVGPLIAVFLAAGGAMLRMLRGQAPATTPFDVPTVDIEQGAQQWAEQRAADLTAGYVQHTRDRLSAAQERLAVAPPTPSGDTVADLTALRDRSRQADADLRLQLETILSRQRAMVAARTETTTATTGGEEFIGGRFDVEVPEMTRLKIWRHRGAIAGTHPCPLCAPLVGTSQNEWSAINPAAAGGPPLHPNACRPGAGYGSSWGGKHSGDGFLRLPARVSHHPPQRSGAGAGPRPTRLAAVA